MMTDKRPFFFLHIPKTAGLTMQAPLARHFNADDIAAAITWTPLLGLDREYLVRKKLFQGHFFGPLEQYIGLRCFRFTILRDPVERALSHYGHVLRDDQHYLHQRALELGSFEAYLDDPVTRMTTINFQARMLALDSDVEAIYRKLSDQERTEWCLERYIETTLFEPDESVLLAKAKKRLASIDVVGITERFEETMALLCYKRGWPFPDEIQARNVNDARPRRTALASSTLNRLADLNAIDIALYELARQKFSADFHLMISLLVTAHAARTPLKRLIALVNG